MAYAKSKTTQNVQVVLPNAIVAKVERLAAANRDSVSHFIRRIIMAELDSYYIAPRPTRKRTPPPLPEVKP